MPPCASKTLRGALSLPSSVGILLFFTILVGASSSMASSPSSCASIQHRLITLMQDIKYSTFCNEEVRSFRLREATPSPILSRSSCTKARSIFTELDRLQKGVGWTMNPSLPARPLQHTTVTNSKYIPPPPPPLYRDEVSRFKDWERTLQRESIGHHGCDSGEHGLEVQRQAKIGAKDRLPTKERIPSLAGLVNNLLDFNMSWPRTESGHQNVWDDYYQVDSAKAEAAIRELRHTIHHTLFHEAPVGCPALLRKIDSSSSNHKFEYEPVLASHGEGGGSLVEAQDLLLHRVLVDTRFGYAHIKNKTLLQKLFVELVAETLSTFRQHGFTPELDASVLEINFVHDPQQTAEAWCAPQNLITRAPWRRFKSTITLNTARPITAEKLQQLVVHEVTHHVQFVAMALFDPDLHGLTVFPEDPERPDETDEEYLAAKKQRAEFERKMNIRARNNRVRRGARYSALSFLMEGGAETAVNLIWNLQNRPRHLAAMLSAVRSLDVDKTAPANLCSVEDLSEWLLKLDELKQNISWRVVMQVGECLQHETCTIDEAVSKLEEQAFVPRDSWPTASFLMEHGSQQAAAYSLGRVTLERFLHHVRLNEFDGGWEENAMWMAFVYLTRSPPTPSRLQHVMDLLDNVPDDDEDDDEGVVNGDL